MASPIDMDKMIEAQIAVVDNMLLNAWGTVYKMAVKYLDFEVYTYELSRTEELLIAKNLVSNLWSVLEYCCIVLCYKYHGIPKPADARKIGFPCDRYVLNCSPSQEDVMKWELGQLEAKLNMELPLKVYEEKFKGAFSDVQFQGGVATDDVKHFYRLNFLRNTLTHQRIDINGDNVQGHYPEIFRVHGIGRNARAFVTVKLPIEPWVPNSTNMKPEPLLDVLYQACKVVESRRNKLLGVLEQGVFRDRFDFKFSEEVLKIMFTQMEVNSECPIRCNDLHLECYGLEAELKKQIGAIRSHDEYLYLHPTNEAQ